MKCCARCAYSWRIKLSINGLGLEVYILLIDHKLAMVKEPNAMAYYLRELRKYK